MTTLTRDLKMVRGDTLTFGVIISGLEDDPDEITFSCKTSKYAKDYLFQKTLGDGINKAESEEGTKYSIRIAPEDTEAVSACQACYDLEIRMVSDVYTILMGTLDIVPDVTRR